MTALSSVTESFRTTFTLMTEKFPFKMIYPAVTNFADYFVHTFFRCQVNDLAKNWTKKKPNAFHWFFFVGAKLENGQSVFFRLRSASCPISDHLDLLSVPQLFGYYWRRHFIYYEPPYMLARVRFFCARSRFSEVQLCSRESVKSLSHRAYKIYRWSPSHNDFITISQQSIFEELYCV